MNILKHPNDILKTKCSKIDLDDKETINILKEMKKFISNDENGAVGLALPQVGIAKRGFVMLVNNKPMIVINPIFLKKQNLYSPTFSESCLSIPEFETHVKRFKNVKMKFTNELGKSCIVELNGFSAVVAQHEYDHLDGILITDK